LKDDITRIVFRYVLLLVLMYGLYVVAHGHLSPGGGFAGGVVLGLGALLYLLIFDLKWRGAIPLPAAGYRRGFNWPRPVSWEAIKYLLPVRHGPTGSPGELFSVGIISVVNLGIGLLVASTHLEYILSYGGGTEKMNWEALMINYPYLVSIIVFGIGTVIVLTQPNLLKKVIGLNIMTSAVFLFYIAFGNIKGGVAADSRPGSAGRALYQPLAFGLILTGIVVGFSTSAFALALIVKLFSHYGTINAPDFMKMR